MEKMKPSIFNDVIGPVMRGPSSSHTAASWRIARICLDVLNEPLNKALIEFDQNGAWASNYREQGTVMGINGGLLGLDITDDKMKESETLVQELGITIDYKISSFPTTHTNTVRLTLVGEKARNVEMIAISTGGGAFEIQQIDNFDISISGDSFELLIWCPESENNIEKIHKAFSNMVDVFESSNEKQSLIHIKSSQEIQPFMLNKLTDQFKLERYAVINPILPIVSGNGTEPPFDTINSMIQFAEEKKINLGDIGLLYEKHLSGQTDEMLRNKMKQMIDIIDGSMQKGLKGTSYKDRILPQQSHLVEQAINEGKILKNPVVNNIIANVSAIMEAKSGMEVIAANPTAGSCGAVGGVLKAIADELGSDRGKVTEAYFAAGIVGVFFAQGPGFSAEEHGCQVECGASSGMAAAGIVQLMGGTTKQAVDAASMAIQNMIGLVCDPVADRVEVPCLGKNISAAMNALSSATMACSGFDAVIPLDEVIQTVSRVGDMMPACVKCTGQGGLAITSTSIQLKKRLEN
jgi:L-serine dehydratase